MALTKISTGGVKDDAASQAKIADEAIDEARLQVSNAGTNGQFLSKQSGNTGGLTWATVTVPDADKIEEGNTSVETVDTGTDGHVKITNEGTETARFSSDGALLIGTTSGTHRLTVQGGGTEIAKFIGTNSADLRFRNSTSNHLLVYTGTGDSLLLGTDGQNERFRIDNEGKLGIGGANFGTSGQVLTSQGTSAAPQWADAGGGAWEVISSTLLDSSSLPSTGGYKYVENKGWTSNYARYKVTFDGINRESPGGGQQTFKLWIQWYMSSSSSSTSGGTLLTGSAYKAKGANIGGSNFTNGDSTKWGPYNDANTYRLSGEITIPMFNSGSEDINKHMYATWVADDELYMERCYYDHNSNASTDHIKGMQIRFVDGGSDLNGRITFLRQKYS